MKNESHIEKMLREMYGDPIDPIFGMKIGDQQAGDSSGGVRDMRAEVNSTCAGCGQAPEQCTCPESGTCPVCGMMPVGGSCDCVSSFEETDGGCCSECGMMEVNGACGCTGLAESEENMKTCVECGMLEIEGSCGCTHLQEESKLYEVAPKGYEDIIKSLKKNPNVDNPWAVAWSMKNKGIQPKKKKSKKSKKKS